MEEINFENLPFDVFEHLCSYINLNDLKNVMLTCKKWYSNTFNKSVSDKIKVYLCRDDYTDYNETSKLKQIIKSKRSFSAVRFNHLAVTDLLKGFLLKYGSQIREISVSIEGGMEATAPYEFISIFEFLHDIRSFQLINNSFWVFTGIRFAKHNPYYVDLLETLLEKEKIEHISNIFEQLTELDICESKYKYGPKYLKYFTNEFLGRVKKLEKLFIDSYFLANEEECYYEFLSKHAKTVRILKIFDCRDDPDYHFSKIFKLKDLKLNTFVFRSHSINYDYFEDFCKMQSSTLQILDIKIRTNISSNYKIISDNLKNLKKLRFDMPMNKITSEELLAFPNMHGLNIQNCNQQENILTGNRMLVLKSLTITNTINIGMIFYITHKFENLEYLSFSTSQDFDLENLKFIYKELVNLKYFSLRIHSCDSNYIYQLRNKIDRINRICNLKKLETLKIISFRRLHTRTLDIDDIAELKNLKKFVFSNDFGPESRNKERYYKLFTKCHKLEFLELEGFSEMDDLLIKLLATNCKNLKTLIIKNCPMVTINAVNIIKKNCKLLKNIELGRLILKIRDSNYKCTFYSSTDSLQNLL